MLAALVPAYAIAVLMPAGPDDGCPSPRQLDDALAAHLPGMVLPLGRPTGPTTLRLAVGTDAAGALRLDLTDPDGGPLLHRWLPAVEHGRTGDCPALAETAALIVERYWHEVGYDVAIEAPPPPTQPPHQPPTPTAEHPPVSTAAEMRAPRPPPSPRAPPPQPRGWLGAGAGGRLGDSGTREGSVSIALGVERPIRKYRIGLRLSAAADITSVAYRWSSTDQVTLRQYPLRMGAYLAAPLGPGQLEPGMGLDLNVISTAVTDGSGTHRLLRGSPGVDVAVGWALPFRSNIYLRLLGIAGAEVPYHFVTTPNQSPFFGTPRFYLDLGLELGLWFP